MSTLDRVDAARARLAQIETAEDASDLVDDLERLREYGRIIDAAPGEINEITFLKVETRIKRVDLVEAGQADGIFRKKGQRADVRPGEHLPVPAPRLAEDRVLRRHGLDEIRAAIDDATARQREVIEKQLLDLARRRRAQTADADARAIQLGIGDITGDGWTLLAGDMRQRLDDIPDGAVDMIVTDPPYPAESMPLWTDLAEHAKRVLAPKGVLVALSGKIMLADVIAQLAEHLSYGWVYCQPLPGPSSRIAARHIGQEWKPWLAFSNGPWPSGRVDWHGDMLHGVPKLKELYHWQQSEQPAGELIVRLSPVNGVVLDPFTGTGTYGLAALRAGRRFLGVEADKTRHAKAAERLGAW